MPPENLADETLATKFGLPAKVAFCKICVISNQRPNSAVEYQHTKDTKKSTIGFDAEGVCDACRFTEKKNREIDWKQRDLELRALCDRFRRDDGRYDCLVPGSGGKDSFYAAHKLKVEYGMHPLTLTWAPHIYTDWGWRNLQLWIHAGFDNHLVTPNGRVHRLLTRLALERLFHPFQPFIIGQKAIAPKAAAALDIPLIFYGENEAEYGNPLLDNSTAKRDHAYFASADQSKIFLSGTSVKELKEDFGLVSNDLEPYMPVHPDALAKVGAEVHYLGYYLKWHPQSCYYYAVEHGGFEASPERVPGTYSKYNSLDDKMDDFHWWTTHVKFGIGHATFDASQEIRSGDIDREEGVALVKRFDGEFPERFLKDLLEYLSIDPKTFPAASARFKDWKMTRESFLALAEQFRSPHLWKKEGGQWKLRHQVR
ncbi:MAG: N-acetyl sugar amidotransferase [Elusimicrobiota bacterium]|nr:N-acetyl sugar amidotransferase [Elusimicrobiota bacterium]